MSKFHRHNLSKVTYKDAVNHFRSVILPGITKQVAMLGDLSETPVRDAWEEYVESLVSSDRADESALNWSYPCR